MTAKRPLSGNTGRADVKEDKIKWLRMQFKKNKVWVASGPDGKPKIEDGKVLMKYQLDQDYEYRVKPANLLPLETGEKAGQPRKKPPGRKDQACQTTEDPRQRRNDKMVNIFTDGASSGNPGPSGIGAVLEYGDHTREISKYIGWSTNNIAELEAIRAGLLELKVTNLPVRIYTDSSYAYGVLTLGWKPKKNQEVIADIRTLMRKFCDVKLIKVKGHAGHRQNERADKLARSAIKNGSRQDAG